MTGRLTRELSELRDGGEQNVALAIDEQEATEAACHELRELFVLVFGELDAQTPQGRAQIKDRFLKLHRLLCQQLDLDRADEANGREHINRPVTVLIKQREPRLTKDAALTSHVRA